MIFWYKLGTLKYHRTKTSMCSFLQCEYCILCAFGYSNSMGFRDFHWWRIPTEIFIVINQNKTKNVDRVYERDDSLLASLKDPFSSFGYWLLFLFSLQIMNIKECMIQFFYNTFWMTGVEFYKFIVSNYFAVFPINTLFFLFSCLFSLCQYSYFDL